MGWMGDPKIKNEMQLPDALVRAALDDRYSRGNADISVTSVIDAPRLHIMGQVYTEELAPVVDVSTRLWPLLGTAFHMLMDQDMDPNVIKEERLFMGCRGWTISGAIDRQVKRGQKVDIEDYKVTSIYTFMHARDGDKLEWQNQLNLYANLAEANGRKVKGLYIIALLRDWRPMEAKTKAGYPPSPIMRLKIPLLPKKERIAYMEERVALHQDAQTLFDKVGEVVECTEAERWHEGDKFAVMRGTNKRALRVFNDFKEADDYRRKLGQSNAWVETREGSFRRCEGYCDYADVCAQWRRVQEDKVVNAVMDKIEEGDK